MSYFISNLPAHPFGSIFNIHQESTTSPLQPDIWSNHQCYISHLNNNDLLTSFPSSHLCLPQVCPQHQNQTIKQYHMLFFSQIFQWLSLSEKFKILTIWTSPRTCSLVSLGPHFPSCSLPLFFLYIIHPFLLTHGLSQQPHTGSPWRAFPTAVPSSLNSFPSQLSRQASSPLQVFSQIACLWGLPWLMHLNCCSDPMIPAQLYFY